jgi:hypothetical protein
MISFPFKNNISVSLIVVSVPEKIDKIVEEV